MDPTTDTLVPYIINAAGSCARLDHARVADAARCLDSLGSFASAQGGTVVAHTLRGVGHDASEDGTGRGIPLVPYNIVGSAQEGKNHAFEASVSGCLQHKGLRPTGNEAGTIIAFQERGRDGGRTLEYQEELAYALRAADGGGCTDWLRVATRASVRRLTPLKAERLQGLPDGWTLVPYRGKPARDGPRYKAIGNAMPVNVMRWIGTRIDLVRAATGERSCS